jgi:hypothetical protein
MGAGSLGPGRHDRQGTIMAGRARRFTPSPAMGIAVVALFIALGGTGYAASQVLHSSRGSKTLAMAAGKKSKSKGPRGPRGPAGARGPVGPRGPAGTPGLNGKNGAGGAAGAAGATGATGVTGNQGNPGPGAVVYSENVAAGSAAPSSGGSLPVKLNCLGSSSFAVPELEAASGDISGLTDSTDFGTTETADPDYGSEGETAAVATNDSGSFSSGSNLGGDLSNTANDIVGTTVLVQYHKSLIVGGTNTTTTETVTFQMTGGTENGGTCTIVAQIVNGTATSTNQ